jgi:Flp pilus assembly protein protease CpaA
MIIADILLIVVVMVVLIIASIIDLKIKEVPDWLNFALISIALGIRLIHAIIFTEWSYFLYGLIGLGAMLALGMVLFYTKQWGGGDTKLLIGLGAVFGIAPYYSQTYLNLPFLLILLVNILIVGAVYSLIWAFVLFLKKRKETFEEMKILIKKKRLTRMIYSIIAILFLGFLYIYPESWLLFVLLSALLFVYPYIYIAIKSVENIGMLKFVSPSKLVEGDWVAEEIKIRGKMICGPRDWGIDKEQIKALKKAKIKKILIKDGVAFVPSILLGTLITLIWPNFIFLLF